MRKITYILVALILLISLTTINIFAEEVNKALIGQKIFAQAIENIEVTISNNEDDDFADIDAIIGDNVVSDAELAEIVGNVNAQSAGVGSVGNEAKYHNGKKHVRWGVETGLGSKGIYVNPINIYSRKVLHETKQDKYFVYYYTYIITTYRGTITTTVKVRRVKKYS